MSRAGRPLAGSAALSVLAAAVAVALVADAPAQRMALLTALAGLGGVAAGLELAHRGRGLAAWLVGLGGGGVVLAGLALGFVRAAAASARVELLPGVVGLAVLTVGLAAAIPGRERHFVTAGTGTVLAGVLTSGVVYGAPAVSLLAATVATVVAWDLGEQAVNMGEHVGREARTWPVELVHGGASVVVGAAAVAAALAVYGTGVTGLPLGGLSALLVASVVLATALYN